MEAINTNYIPREWLALKINACRMALEVLPEATIILKKIRNRKVPVCIVAHHTYTNSRDIGKKYFAIAEKRQSYKALLEESECKWHTYFQGAVPEDLTPHKVVRKLNTGNNQTVTINKEFFDSLENDADPEYPESKRYYFNGVYYRSVAEKDIAEFYTINNIPFKYEPEIWISGMNKPIHPDFVIYIKEIDCCKFHEHIGMMSHVQYLRTTRNKYLMYIDAGLIPDQDILFTYDTADQPFDIRTLWPRLNAMVYCSLFVKANPKYIGPQE